MKIFSNIIVRIFNYLTVVMLAVVTLSSCDSSSRLASEIEGQWTGTPERVTQTELSYVTLTPSYEFTRNDGAEADKDAGTVVFAAQIDAQIPADGFPADSLGETPVSFSVAAVSTVKGTWKATDDDEVTVKFTPSSILTSIDSKAVCEYTSPVSMTDRAQTMELPRRILDQIESQLNATITTYVSSITKLDDIKVKGQTLKFEIGKKDCVLSR